MSAVNGTGKTLHAPGFQKAYENGTRSKDGSVPATYWQNRSTYDIEASVDPGTGILKGSAAITYFNNSPDTLRSVVFHTYHDYLKPYTSRQNFDPLTSEAEDHKGMLIEQLIVAGDTVEITNPERIVYRGTNYGVKLAEPLPPNKQLRLQIKWQYEIPDERQSRSGVFDSTSMFVGYWYPEMAVRDDISGWDTKAFDAATEFYHDFSDYKIALNLPEAFTVWASVPPDNPEEVYSEKVQDRLEQARKSSSGIKILTQEDFKPGTGEMKTWKYTANDFPDFAFAFSDHFLWEAATYEDEEGEDISFRPLILMQFRDLQRSFLPLILLWKIFTGNFRSIHFRTTTSPFLMDKEILVEWNFPEWQIMVSPKKRILKSTWASDFN